MLEVLKTSLGMEMDDEFDEGLTSTDIVLWLEYVRVQNLSVGVKLRYKWKPIKVEGGFVINMIKAIIGRVGNYVMVGKAARNNVEYDKLAMRFGGGKANKKRNKKVVKADRVYLTEGQKMVMYTKVAVKCKLGQCDHAVGLKVRKNEAICYNNGCTNGSIVFSAENMAKQMIGLYVCYGIDLNSDE